MRPIPIPDDVFKRMAATHPGLERRVIAAPDGDLTNEDVGAVEALVYPHELTLAGQKVTVDAHMFVLVCEDDEAQTIAETGFIMLRFLGQVPPFSIIVHNGKEAA